jgi:membrane associated rhomboid family serine protease
MIDRIPPRVWAATAVAALVLGVGSLYIGWLSWGPIAILAAEILAILAAITFTTPSIGASLSAQRANAHQATPEQPANETNDQTYL